MLAKNEQWTIPYHMCTVHNTDDQRKCLKLYVLLFAGVVDASLDSVAYRLTDYGPCTHFQLKQEVPDVACQPNKIATSYTPEQKADENWTRGFHALKDWRSKVQNETGEKQIAMTTWEIPFKVNKYIGKADIKCLADKKGGRMLQFTFWSLEQSSHSSAKPDAIQFVADDDAADP